MDAGERESVSAADVAQYVKARIRRGSLVPGQRLVEAEIIEKTGATRGRVRDALKQLALEQIVSIEAFRGAVVKQLSRAEFAQIYDAREAVEGQAARLLALSGDTAAYAGLVALQKKLDEAERDLEFDRFAELNDKWHEYVLQNSGNTYLLSFVERLRLPVFRLLHRTFFVQSAIAASNAGHRRIVEAIVTGDGEGAESAMREHIRGGFAALSAGDDPFVDD